jgi:metal-responsive CopG/Arc/MetJ family transcriptional regulator
MSRITITIPNDLIEELLGVIDAKSKTDAVIKAIKNEIKRNKKERIKFLAGKIDFTVEAHELRHGDERVG